MPTPTQLVELSFGFASQFLELRKAYTLKVAEMIAEASKTAETAVKNAQIFAQANVQMNQAIAQAKTSRVSFPRNGNKAARHAPGRFSFPSRQIT